MAMALAELLTNPLLRTFAQLSAVVEKFNGKLPIEL